MKKLKSIKLLDNPQVLSELQMKSILGGSGTDGCGGSQCNNYEGKACMNFSNPGICRVMASDTLGQYQCYCSSL